MKFGVLRSGASLAAATLTAFASTACGTNEPTYVHPETVSHSELVGRWDGGRECGSPLPVIRLRDDYTYTVKDYPIEWNGPVRGEQVTRRSTDGKWHAVTKDPDRPPYLVLRFEKGGVVETDTLVFTVDKGALRMGTTVEAHGDPEHTFSCRFKRTSTDPEFGR
ncbi:hypothetical protein ACN9M0_29885 [Streptomyces sp. R-07]|uniref:hypothetical protein n=1 Tax=unclassified Streptomyces TaxID=2593676 RepID=UPI003440D39D